MAHYGVRFIYSVVDQWLTGFSGRLCGRDIATVSDAATRPRRVSPQSMQRYQALRHAYAWFVPLDFWNASLYPRAPLADHVMGIITFLRNILHPPLTSPSGDLPPSTNPVCDYFF